MLATLIPDLKPLRRSPWRSLVSVRRGRQLIPGVWIGRSASWAHAAVLDSNATLPEVIADPGEAIHQVWPVPAWHTWALCGGLSFAAFFGAASDERPTMKRSEVTHARGVCAACPVARECLDSALTNGEAFGVWGGTSGRQRAIMRAKMKAGTSQVDVMDGWFNQWLGT